MKKCPICTSEKISTNFTIDQWLESNKDIESPVHSFTKLVAENNGYEIEEIDLCDSCGFRFAFPYPDNDNLSKYYSEYYANTSYSRKKNKKIKRARKRIRALNKNQNYKTFLDVGCNIGTAVEAARLEGMEGCGVEIDGESIKMAKSYFPENEFEVISVQDFSKTGRKFDVIYSTEVVEHLNDPDSFFAAVSELLSPQGVFYLTTPDGGHFMTPKKEKIMRWHEMKLPEHISIFTKKSLSHLLNKHGFNKQRFVLNIKSGLKCISRKTT